MGLASPNYIFFYLITLKLTNNVVGFSLEDENYVVSEIDVCEENYIHHFGIFQTKNNVSASH
ncbi:hypothetical protein H6G10_19565 [Anabaena cylindrica FACHB-170]|uniref:Uncharacterized protein n=1 Tax=Trichormus variabilis NIES-23 TaxID=1973479 RepID=A0A1Z4KEP0_ANAVA|nr:hypothetical protein [Anabaena cylindrica FACHB-170]RUR82903.1 hypothetical protein DSM107007_33430 [Nostoc sp. PCC 7120 = FACHB-418]BAB73517.1 asr1818 [Nostoc sp. PCC 7120 = FACHB-418]BAY67434.1 hypothetical protein NIES23_02070 [Trichormus variabilis NIES-23]HBW30918.1 hypothetical protein [Nostoc sp. UBA8866]